MPLCGGSEVPDWKRLLKGIKKDVDTLKEYEKQDEVVEKQQIVNKIQRSLDDYRTISEIQNPYREELDKLRKLHSDDIDNIRRERDRNDNILRGYKELEGDHNKLKKEHKEKEEECHKLKKEHKEKEEECHNLLKMVQTGESKIDKVQIKNQHLDEENKRLQNRVAELEQKTKDYKETLHLKETTLNKNYKETESLQQHVAEVKTSEERLRQQLEETKYQVKGLEEENKDYRNQMTSLVQELKVKVESVKSLEVENNGYRNQITRLEKSIESYKKEMTTLGHQLSDANNQNSRLEKSIESYKNEMTALDHQLQEAHMQSNSLTQQVTEYYNRCCDLEGELQARIQNHNQSVNKLQESINNLHKSVIAERKAKEDALNRLSAAAASRLRDNNPSITDLSDPNRPLKLAEKISELYDNEWTNAMENLEAIDVEEEEGVAILLNIFTKIFERCQDLAAEHLKNLPQVLALPQHISTTVTETKLGTLQSLPTDILKPLKDFRKINAIIVVPVIEEVIRKELGDTEKPLIKDLAKNKLVECKEYVQKCVELCWMMRVQDPPVHMKWKFEENDKFNVDLLRSYTKSGKYVDFVVWPVLYLHEDGPLLAKGVAQGKKDNSKKEKEVKEDATASTSAPIPSTSVTADSLAEKDAVQDGPALSHDVITNANGINPSSNENLSAKQKADADSRKSSSSSYDSVSSNGNKNDTSSGRNSSKEGSENEVDSLPSQESKETMC